VKARAVIAKIEANGGQFLRQHGYHRRYAVAYDDNGITRTAHTTVQMHPGRDIPNGTLRAIERDLEVALGKGWLG
jgi:predicted RNA binding protein YcfA (HicA-like mRNA interferase family)